MFAAVKGETLLAKSPSVRTKAPAVCLAQILPPGPNLMFAFAIAQHKTIIVSYSSSPPPLFFEIVSTY